MVEDVGAEHDGDRLSALMRRARVSDGQLAVAADATVQAVGKWKRTGNIARDRIAPICRALHCSSDELLGLRSISAIAEPCAAYGDFDRDAMRLAIVLVEEEIARQGVSVKSPAAKAEVFIAAYDFLQTHTSLEVAKRAIGGMLRMLAASHQSR